MLFFRKFSENGHKILFCVVITHKYDMFCVDILHKYDVPTCMPKDKFLRNILSCMLITFSSGSFFTEHSLFCTFLKKYFFIIFAVNTVCSMKPFITILPFYCFSSMSLFVFHPKCTYDGSTWCNLFIRRWFFYTIMKFKSFLAKKY